MGKINFSEKEKESVKQAVKKVEETTSGEIVTYFVKKSGNYTDLVLLVSLLSALFFLTIINILAYFWILPFKFNVLDFSVYQVLIFTVVFLLVNYVSPLKRLIISKHRIVKTVKDKALNAFAEEEVFSTKDRTGVLIFISEFEHQVQIIADSGINKKMDNKERTELVDTVIRGIKNKKAAEGIITAIHFYGNILVKNGFTIQKDDTNELKDDLRTE